MSADRFDVIIIGSGPGGYPTAAALAAAGKRVAIIEARELGGTCLNRGCIPTKCLCRSAEVALTVADAARFGIDASQPCVNFPVIMERKDMVVNELRGAVASVLKDVELINARAVFLPDGSIQADGQLLSAPTVIIATGSKPAPLPIPGAELALDSDSLLSLSSLPESIAIIGGGVIGLEFASVFNALGVKVTVVEFCPEVLPQMEPDMAKRLRTALKRRGIEFIVDAAVTAVTPCGLEYTRKGKPGSVTAQMVAMAVGRKAVIPAGLDLELTPPGFIKVNPATMETSRPGVYAVGDCNGLCLLAHAASAQGSLVANHLLYRPASPQEPIPAAVFTIPEMAAVGLTEKQAREAGYEVRIGRSGFHSNGKALALGESDGAVKTVIDASTGRLLGATILGPHAADLLGELTLAIATGIPAAEVAATIHPHPTLSEALLPALR